jgi:hypothetical protein
MLDIAIYIILIGRSEDLLENYHLRDGVGGDDSGSSDHVHTLLLTMTVESLVALHHVSLRQARALGRKLPTRMGEIRRVWDFASGS